MVDKKIPVKPADRYERPLFPALNFAHDFVWLISPKLALEFIKSQSSA